MKDNKIIRVLNTTRNFYCPILVYLGIIEKCEAKLIDGTIVKVSQSNWKDYWNRITLLHMKRKLHFKALSESVVKIRFKNKEVRFKLPEIPSKFDEFIKRILEQFYFEQYKPLSVKSKVIIDVGAWIGDTSIYFALRGAKKVIALEPHPYSFELLKENIKLNGLMNWIIPVNAGLSSECGEVFIPMNVIDTSSLSLKKYSVPKKSVNAR